MLELDFQNIFSTIGVGIFSMVFAFYYLTSIMYKIIPLSKIKNEYKSTAVLCANKKISKPFFLSYLEQAFGKKSGEFSKSAIAIFLFILLYGFGVMIQDFAGHMTDEDSSYTPCLATKTSLRRSVLINKNCLTPLGCSIFQDGIVIEANKHVGGSFFTKLNSVDNYWNTCRSSLDTSNRRFDNFIADIYYTAKNWSYLYTENIYEELQSIQNRIDFSRSINFISFWFALFSIAIIACWHFVLYDFKRAVKKNTTDKNALIHLKTVKKIYSPGFPLGLVMLLLSFWFSKEGYKISSENYNKRVFGYYVTHSCYNGQVK